MSDGMMFIQNEAGKFEKYSDAYDITIHCESAEEQERILNILENSQWIPCSERLPKRDGTYQIQEFIATINDGEQVYASRASYDFESHKWIYHNGEVVAWMPLPEPYREEE